MRFDCECAIDCSAGASENARCNIEDNPTKTWKIGTASSFGSNQNQTKTGKIIINSIHINGIGQFILVWGKPQKSEKPRNKPNTGKIWKPKAEARSVSECRFDGSFFYFLVSKELAVVGLYVGVHHALSYHLVRSIHPVDYSPSQVSTEDESFFHPPLLGSDSQLMVSSVMDLEGWNW